MSRRQHPGSGVRGNVGLAHKSKGFVKWKCLAHLENGKLSRVERRDSNKTSIKEVGFATWIFSGSSKTTFLSS